MSDLIAATDEHARALSVLLADSGMTVATAESLTGGLVGAAITERPGASAVYRGGVIAYSTLAKERVLDVPAALLREFGPVHATTAVAMARHARKLFGADLGVATTGAAGPDPVGDIPPGVMFVAAEMHGGPVKVERLERTGERGDLRRVCASAALRLAVVCLGEARRTRRA